MKTGRVSSGAFLPSLFSNVLLISNVLNDTENVSMLDWFCFEYICVIFVAEIAWVLNWFGTGLLLGAFIGVLFSEDDVWNCHEYTKKILWWGKGCFFRFCFVPFMVLRSVLSFQGRATNERGLVSKPKRRCLTPFLSGRPLDTSEEAEEEAEEEED